MAPEPIEVLSPAELGRTVDVIEATQHDDGCIPWWPGGRADPWDLVEAAMALDVGERHRSAERAYRWLARTQRADGAWAAGYENTRVVDPTLDANFSSYVATGVWHHWVTTEDERFLAEMWPAVERAIEFVIALQVPDGSVLWARDAHLRAWPGALLTSSSCIHLSLKCATSIAQTLGFERPDWELSLALLANAICERRDAFEPKERFSMDWYYPILGGALTGRAAEDRVDEDWERFVVGGRGCRCVSDRPWVTAAETCELVMALHLMGRTAVAMDLFEWVQHLRDEDGAYWTGATFPDDVVWPREKTTWSAGAVVLAADALRMGAATTAVFGRSRSAVRPSSPRALESLVDSL